jgi:hypothetical protein
MTFLFIFISLINFALGDEALNKYEHCFLSQHAFGDSSGTADLLLQHQARLDPNKAVMRDKKTGYKVIRDAELRLCFSFQAYPKHTARIEKEISKFREKYRESEINISDRLVNRPVQIVLTARQTSGPLKQSWELNEHLNLVYDPMKKNEIKLRFAKHVHVEKPHHTFLHEDLLKNRFLSDETLNIRAQYLHERLVKYDISLSSGKAITINRGTGRMMNLQEVIKWLLNDQTGAVYSFYPAESFNPSTGVMLFNGEIELKP